MKIEVYRKYCEMLKKQFPNSYSNHFLNTCWNLWKDLDDSQFQFSVLKAIKDNKPLYLDLEAKSIKGKQELNIEDKPKSKAPYHQLFKDEVREPINYDTLDNILKENNCTSLVDLIFKSKI